jgi:hypothetical protein
MMGCDSPDVDVGKIYGRPMPEEKEEGVAIERISSCLLKNKHGLNDRVFDLRLGKRRMIIDAPRDPDGAFLANALNGARVRYSFVTRPRGRDGEYHLDELHRFEILEGPLAGNAYEMHWWKIDPRELQETLPDAQQRRDVECIEGMVGSCIAEGRTLHAQIGEIALDIPMPAAEWPMRYNLPEPPLLAYAMLGSKVRYETFKLRSPVELVRQQLYREKPSPENHHRIAFNSGRMNGYEFEWAV